MNFDLHCPSTLELAEVLTAEMVALDDELRSVERHLQDCLRCQALLRLLRADPPLKMPVELPARAVTARGASRADPAGVRLRSGALWRASGGPDADFAWVVALVGRSPDADDLLLVVPVCPEPTLATDQDLLIDPQVLGYEAFLDMTNLGTVERGQLIDAVGELDRSTAQALVAAYRHVMGGGPFPQGVRRGVAALDEGDPRLLDQAERAQALRELFRRADLRVDGEQAPARSGAATAAAAAPAQAEAPRLSELVGGRIEGSEADWDRVTLLEASGADGASLDGFLTDRLDLTDRRDVVDLARVLHALQIDSDQAEPSVLASLRVSKGGAREAEGPTLRAAARSRAGAQADQTTRDLFADQSRVDSSDAAREREMRTYLAELRRELDGLD